VRQDEREAVRWYRKAADQGVAAAQSFLGFCYVTGTGVEKDRRKAVRWYRKAANQGHKTALRLLRDLEQGRHHKAGVTVYEDIRFMALFDTP
jgi:hypothetical protein